MKRVEWWIAKVYPPKEMKKRRKGENPIDLWDQFKTEKEARDDVRKEGGPGNPFTVIKVTYETVSSSGRR